MNICEAREAYDYPTSHIRIPNPDCADDHLIYVEALVEKPEQSKYQFRSTRSLDDYHCELLNSENAEKNRIGIASVIYWGTYYNKQSPNHGLAFSRTNKFLKITQDVTTPLSTARNEINSNNYGLALKEILKIKRLGIAFGTKVLAFLNPDKVGVYDLHISRYINNPSLAMVTTGYYSKEKQKAFDGFCNYLNAKALGP